MAHAVYAPSAAKRWTECPASIPASVGYVSEDSAASLEGTRAHECFETFIRNGPDKLISTTAMLKKSYPLDMVLHAEKSAAWAFSQCPPKRFEIHAEVKLVTPIDPDFGGTADMVAFEDYGTLHVLDFKYGFHIVEPEENLQLMAYALGAVARFGADFERLRLSILQPRAEHPVSRFRSWETDLEPAVDKYGQIFLSAIMESKSAKPRYKSGDHCTFCPARVECKYLRDLAHADARVAFGGKPDTIEKARKSLPRMSPEQLGLALDGCDRLDIWTGAIRERAVGMLMLGHKIPGWKLVPKRASRKWNDAQTVDALVRKKFGKAALTEPELLSPAQLEKVSPKAKAFVAEHSSAVSSGVTLARESDPRPAHDQLAIDFAAPVVGEATPPAKAKSRTTAKAKGKLR